MKSQMEKLVESWDTQNELFFEDHLELHMEGYTSDAPLMKQRLLDLCRSEAHYSLKPIERKLLELYYENGYTTVTRANGRLFLSKPNGEEKNTREIAQIDPSYLADIDWGTNRSLKIEDILNTYAVTESGTDPEKVDIDHGKGEHSKEKVNIEPKKADIDEPHLTPEEHQTLRNLCYDKPMRYLYGDKGNITALEKYPKVTEISWDKETGGWSIEPMEGWNEQVNIKNEWLYNRVKGKVIPIIDILNSDGLPEDTKGGVEMTPKEFTDLTEGYRNGFIYACNYDGKYIMSEGITEHYSCKGVSYLPRGEMNRFSMPKSSGLREAVTERPPKKISQLTASARVERATTTLLSGIEMEKEDYNNLEDRYFYGGFTYLTCKKNQMFYEVHKKMPLWTDTGNSSIRFLFHGRYKELEKLAGKKPVFIGYILGHCKIKGGEE